jgi:hypothetical protein
LIHSFIDWHEQDDFSTNQGLVETCAGEAACPLTLSRPVVAYVQPGLTIKIYTFFPQCLF